MHTNTMALVRSGQFKRAFHNYVDNLLARMIFWLLSKHVVQQAIVASINNHGLMCRVISDAVESNMNGIDVDDVHNLDGYLDNYLEHNFEVDAENVSGLDKAIQSEVEDALDNAEFTAAQITDLNDAVGECLASDKDMQTELTAVVVAKIAEKLAH